MNTRGFSSALFYLGISLPGLYLLLFYSRYLQLWSQVPATLLTVTFAGIVAFAGIAKVLCYLAKQATRSWNKKFSDEAGRASFLIHMGIAIPVMVAVFAAAASRLPPTHPDAIGLRFFFVFLAVEFLIFPLMALAYLQETIRLRKEGVVTPFLLGMGLYASVMFLYAAADLEIPRTLLGAAKLTPLELIGAKLHFLFILTAIFVASPAFWGSLSISSLDSYIPPEWLGAIFVLAVGAYFYRPLGDLPSSETQEAFRLKFSSLGVRLFTAILGAYLIVTLTSFVAPQNVATRALVLFGILLAILLLTRLTRSEVVVP